MESEDMTSGSNIERLLDNTDSANAIVLYSPGSKRSREHNDEFEVGVSTKVLKCPLNFAIEPLVFGHHSRKTTDVEVPQDL